MTFVMHSYECDTFAIDNHLSLLAKSKTAVDCYHPLLVNKPGVGGGGGTTTGQQRQTTGSLFPCNHKRIFTTSSRKSHTTTTTIGTRKSTTHPPNFRKSTARQTTSFGPGRNTMHILMNNLGQKKKLSQNRVRKRFVGVKFFKKFFKNKQNGKPANLSKKSALVLAASAFQRLARDAFETAAVEQQDGFHLGGTSSPKMSSITGKKCYSYTLVVISASQSCSACQTKLVMRRLQGKTRVKSGWQAFPA